MARSESAYLGKPRGDRRLAPAQIAAIGIIAFLVGTAAAGSGLPGAGILAASLIPAFFTWRRSRSASILIPLACLAGMLYYRAYFAIRVARTAMSFDVPISFSGIVSAEPRRAAKSEYFPLRLAPPLRGTIKVLTSPDRDVRYGDILKLQGNIQAPEIKRDVPVSIFPEIEKINAGQGPPVRQALSDLKRRLLRPLSRYLPPVEAAFLGGITLGARSSFSPEFTAALAASGTTHLVALSGYNIAIVVFVVFSGCVRIFGRRAAFWLTTLAILLFVVMVGAEPSIVRAAAMGFMVLLARELGRPYGLPFALLWTALFMVLWDPSQLFMSGFQLSFMSLLGIVYLSPLVLPWFGGRATDEVAFLGGFRENAALTISAQLAIVPIAMSNFGSISLASFLANALILPFMPLTMFFGFVLIACGLILPPLGLLAGLLSHALLAYEIGIIHFFAAFPAAIKIPVPIFGIVVYYLALAVVAHRRQARDER